MFDPKDCYLDVIEDLRDGLFHGAVYENKRTPSGCDRYLLSVSTKKGYFTIKSAAIAINNEFPGLEQLPINKIPGGTDEIADKVLYKLSQGYLLTVLIPAMKEEDPFVEVKSNDSLKEPVLDIDISIDQFNVLLRKGLIELSSSSGEDPELNYKYDNYLVK